MTTTWTSVADIRARVRRRWDDGTLLRAYSTGEDFPVIDIALRGPKASEIGDDTEAVKGWVATLDAGRQRDASYVLAYSPVGGRLFGRNDLPSRALISRYSQAWTLLGTTATVRRLDEILTATQTESVVRSWVNSNPLKAIDLHTEWPRLLAAYRWLDDHRGSGRYIRQIDAPDVDTKFVERHRGLLASLLRVPASAATFLNGLGLAAKPEMLRLRIDPSLAAFATLTDVTARLDELRTIPIKAVRTAVIVENEVTFLSVPVPEAGVVLWGKGFEVGRAGSLPWLRGAEVHYWGDLDTHGFAILNQLRAWLPQTRSFLMDRETLLDHQGRWGQESSPTRAHLVHLNAAESGLYDDLVTDRLGDRVRLEQERIDWRWAQERFPYA